MSTVLGEAQEANIRPKTRGSKRQSLKWNVLWIFQGVSLELPKPERDVMVAPPGILADTALDVSLASPRKGPPKGHRHSLTVHGATCGHAKPSNACIFLSTKASPQSFHPVLLLR